MASIPEAGTDPGDLDLSIPQGMSQRIELEIENPDGTPYILEGYKARLHVKAASTRGLPTGEPLLQMSSEGTGPPITFENGAAGELNVVVVQIEDEDADQLPVMLPGPPDRRGIFDLVLESEAGEKPLRIQGRVRTRPKVAP